MEQKIPFTSYDSWACLSAGFLLLFAFDSVAGTKLLMRDSWTVVQSVVAVALAYMAGQLVASGSSFLFEKVLVGQSLGYLRNVLFGQPKAWKWVRRCIPNYFEPLPTATQKAALARGGMVGVNAPGEALFWPTFAKRPSNGAGSGQAERLLEPVRVLPEHCHGGVRRRGLLLQIVPPAEGSCGPPAVSPNRARCRHRDDAAVPKVLPTLRGRGVRVREGT